MDAYNAESELPANILRQYKNCKYHNTIAKVPSY